MAPNLEVALKACVSALNALDKPESQAQFLAIKPVLEKGREALAKYQAMRDGHPHRTEIARAILFYADERNWTEGDVPEHIYAHHDKGWHARQAMQSPGWTASGLQLLDAGAPDLEIK